MRKKYQKEIPESEHEVLLSYNVDALEKYGKIFQPI